MITKILKYLIVFLIGASAGWLVHDNWANRFSELLAGFQDSERTVKLSEGESSEKSVKNLIKSVGEIESPAIADKSSSSISKQPELEPESTSGTNESLLNELESSDFARAVVNCVVIDDQQGSLCRDQIMQYAISDKISELESKYLLELWLAEYPDDFDAASILISRDITNEKYVKAAQRLALVYSYQTEPGKRDKISQQTQNFARRAIIKLTITDDILGLQSLLTTLIEMEPEQGAWRYSLAKAQFDFKQFADAINTLTYILFDSDWGDRANLLYEEISKKLNLAGYTEIPLKKVGSQFLVKVMINGLYELTLLLDTGASITAINSDSLKKLGLPSRSDRTIILDTAGSKVTSSLITIKSFSAGAQTINNLDIASIRFKNSQFDGLLGMNFLDNFRFIIDQKQRKLLLKPN